jgi:predicted enzyme related to lactoylglutathione lyase
VYFAVTDCDATCKKIEALGGRIESPPMDIPEVGRFAVCCDPQGAHFAVIHLMNPQD